MAVKRHAGSAGRGPASLLQTRLGYKKASRFAALVRSLNLWDRVQEAERKAGMTRRIRVAQVIKSFNN